MIDFKIMRTPQKLSVSIVDDDEFFSRSLEHYLSERMKQPLKLKRFSTGEEFLKKMNETKPDVVILDYMLNGLNPFAMNGRDVLQKIRQLDADLTVIMVSGQDRIEVALESIKDGAYEYVVKNDNVFLKLYTILRTAGRTISISRRLKRYQWWSSAALVLLTVGIVVELLVLAFF